ncbi:MAG: hypothetical protein WC847_02900 [Candidatus Paceibacterota bacterium]|jgi:hypothetical protein
MKRIVLEPAVRKLLHGVSHMEARGITENVVVSIQDGASLGFPVDVSVDLLLSVTPFREKGWRFLRESIIPDDFNLTFRELVYVVMNPFQFLPDSPDGCLLAVKNFLNGTAHVIIVRAPKEFNPGQRFLLVQSKDHADLSIEELEESQHPLDATFQIEELEEIQHSLEVDLATAM